MRERKRGKILIVSAPSGTGKTTVCEHLFAGLTQCIKSISFTTRPMREEEREGEAYYFIGEKKFLELREKGELAEWAIVHDQWYGTSRAVLEEALKDGKIVILTIDVQGAKKIKAVYPRDTVTIFLLPPSLEELERRLRGRGSEAEREIKKRLKHAQEEMAEAQDYDFRVINKTIEQTVKEIKEIVEATEGR